MQYYLGFFLKCLSKYLFFVKHYIGISKTVRQSMSPLSQSRMAICRLFKKGGMEIKNATKALVFFNKSPNS